VKVNLKSLHLGMICKQFSELVYRAIPRDLNLLNSYRNIAIKASLGGALGGLHGSLRVSSGGVGFISG
jgi:hypothetical protein